VPRSGRRPGESDTRERIATAARTLFAERGLDATSMRAVAAEAGVDPALVHHYFGSKGRLFLEAVDFPIDAIGAIREVAAGDPDQVGERLIRFAVRLWDDPAVLPRLLGILRSAVTDAQAARMLGTMFTRQGPVQLVRSLGSSNPNLRAELVGSQLVGLAIARHILRVEPLASADADTLAAAIGPTMQRYLVGDIGIEVDRDLAGPKARPPRGGGPSPRRK
jgi:AcrR family transcriptional regulator